MRARRRRQAGQTIVLVALAMSAMMAMTALVISAGQLYWARRQAQELADAGALAAAALIPCSGQNGYAAADGVVSRQLGAAPVLSQTPGPCGPSATSWARTYPDGTRVTATYPYVDTSRIQVVVVSGQVTLPLGGLLGASQSTVTARAVARNSGASAPLNYAVYSLTGITCEGSSPNNVRGSVYSGGPIDTNCSLYAHAIPGVDAGDLLVHATGQQWNRGGGACSAGLASGNVICADGFEISRSQCPAPGSTDFLGASREGYPCPSSTVQQPSFAPYTPPEPNADASAVATVGGTACDPNGMGAAYPPLLIGATAVGRLRPGVAVVRGLTVGNAPYRDAAGYYHFRPGCYGWLDVSLVQSADPAAKAAVIFDPGFYYFSGYYQPSDSKGKQGPGTAGGLCLGAGTQALGKDVLFELTSNVDAASFSSSTCDAAPSASTNTSFGADPASPVNDGGELYGYLSAPCDAGVNPSCPLAAGSSWCPRTDTSCSALLIWAPPGPPATALPAINGTFYAKGPSEQSWLYGTVFWPGSAGGNPGCQWTANGTATITGSLICLSVQMQGGSSSGGVSVTYARSDTNSAPSQAGLIE